MRKYLEVKFRSPTYEERTINFNPEFLGGGDVREIREILRRLRNEKESWRNKRDWLMYTVSEANIQNLEYKLYKKTIIGD